MKIKVTKRSYQQVMLDKQTKKRVHKKPIKPSLFFRTLMRVVSIPDLRATHFKLWKIGMEKLKKASPHSFS